MPKRYRRLDLTTLNGEDLRVALCGKSPHALCLMPEREVLHIIKELQLPVAEYIEPFAENLSLAFSFAGDVPQLALRETVEGPQGIKQRLKQLMAAVAELDMSESQADALMYRICKMVHDNALPLSAAREREYAFSSDPRLETLNTKWTKRFGDPVPDIQWRQR